MIIGSRISQSGSSKDTSLWIIYCKILLQILTLTVFVLVNAITLSMLLCYQFAVTEYCGLMLQFLVHSATMAVTDSPRAARLFDRHSLSHVVAANNVFFPSDIH